ncbi:MAG TPA: FG-GAP-like repeat-containing protein [Pyrinomonadaceae bacterium]|nr:FG-GAP-like repeat-containing protein [Pyrinomonadaceae bacterium]
MKSPLAVVILLVLFLSLAIAGATLIESSAAMFSPEAGALAEQSAFEKSEAAYRANNIGAAMLEQYKARDAVESFTRALEIKPDLLIARINLSIALYYLPDADGAKREAEKSLIQDSNKPQPHYILGLIARAQNRFEAAVAEFQKILVTDPDDVGSNINVGQIFAQQKNYGEAIAAFRRAIAAEPYNETALYNLGILLTRTGNKIEGQRLLQKFQELKQSGAGTTIGTNYLEGGHYAEAVVATGIEPELVDRAAPSVAFIDATQQFLPAESRPSPTRHRPKSPFEYGMSETNARAQAIVLFDYDGDGDLDIFDASGSQRLLRNDGGKFTDVTAGSGLSITGSQYSFAAVAGDYDNDGRPDLFVARFAEKRFVLYHNDGNGHFSDRTKESKIEQPRPEGSPYDSAAFVDVDHDGDLDIFIAGPVNILYRNNGDGTFSNITEEAKVAARNSFSSASTIIPTDYDNRRDVDIFLLPSADPPRLFRNMRDGTFSDVGKEVGLDDQGAFRCAAAGDINKDGFTDFFMSIDTRAVFAMSDGHGRFKLNPAPADTKQALAAQFLDYDNDGLLDLVTLTTRGLRVWRNVGNGFVDVSEKGVPMAFRNLDARFGFPGMFSRQTAFASADLDGDGDIDLIMRGPGGQLKILRNDGGNRNHSLAVKLRGRISNKNAVEAKVEMRAGSLYQKLEIYSACPAPAPADVIFGLGKREKPDVVRVLWPAGIVQAETEFGAQKEIANFISLNITELDRKPSSCPYLYTWNGQSFEFITDFMGGGEMGYLEEPGHYNKPDPEEYVRIRGDQLKEKDGRYELRVTNELEEAMFVDRLQLIAIAHPLGLEIYPNEGMSDPPKPFKLFVTHNSRPPLSAIDDHGHDVLDLISRMDRRWPDDFKLDRIRGYADQHSLTIKLPSAGNADVPSAPRRRSLSEQRERPTERRSLSAYQGGKAAKASDGADARVKNGRAEQVVLLLTGWTDYAWSSDNVAASQAGKAMKPPVLQVKDEKGIWRTVIDDIGIPVGRPQTVTVDLTGKFLSPDREVRIVTNMRIYWDQILIDTSDGKSSLQTTLLDPARADLRWRGFSAEVTPDGREPFGYDYRRVSFTSPWKVMTGRYTREGDVRELLLKSDDMFVVSRPGDEISLSFNASALPPLPAGWTRTFLLYADGFSKEMDINSASPDQLVPLPFHGMSRYPYPWTEHYPLTEGRRRYIEQYNTRIVTAPVPSIGSFLVR